MHDKDVSINEENIDENVLFEMDPSYEYGQKIRYDGKKKKWIIVTKSEDFMNIVSNL
jgi:hypothetical protein